MTGRGKSSQASSSRPSLRYESDPAALAEADFYIVTVPTPIDSARRPDLGAMLAASETVGGVLKRGDIVVYESTVYPGAVEEDCVPVLEKTSGLAAGAISPSAIRPSASIPATRSTASKRSPRWCRRRMRARSISSPTSMARW